jgi:hypothetical protein
VTYQKMRSDAQALDQRCDVVGHLGDRELLWIIVCEAESPNPRKSGAIHRNPARAMSPMTGSHVRPEPPKWCRNTSAGSSAM